MDETQRDPAAPAAEYTEQPTAGAGAGVPATRSSSGKRVFWIVLLMLLAFLGGFGWQYYRAMTIEDQLERTEQALAIERLRVGLAQAAVAAQSGDFEAARRGMSEFFTATQERLPELRPQTRVLAEEMLRDRDDVITGLSRANPEYATILYGMLQRFQTSLEPAAPPVAPLEAADSPGG